MKLSPHLRTIAAGLALGLCASLTYACAQAPDQEAGFQRYLQELSARARSEEVSEGAIARMTAGLTFNPRVVARDRSESAPSSTPSPVAPYLRTHVNADRIAKGRGVRDQSAGLLGTIEQRYGVPGKKA